MSSPDLAYSFVKDPLLVREAPSDMASLAALLGEAELADARSPLAMAIAHFEQHVRQQLQVRTSAGLLQCMRNKAFHDGPMQPAC